MNIYKCQCNLDNVAQHYDKGPNTVDHVLLLHSSRKRVTSDVLLLQVERPEGRERFLVMQDNSRTLTEATTIKRVLLRTSPEDKTATEITRGMSSVS